MQIIQISIFLFKMIIIVPFTINYLIDILIVKSYPNYNHICIYIYFLTFSFPHVKRVIIMINRRE